VGQGQRAEGDRVGRALADVAVVGADPDELALVEDHGDQGSDQDRGRQGQQAREQPGQSATAQAHATLGGGLGPDKVSARGLSLTTVLMTSSSDAKLVPKFLSVKR
jgi:hypothetical protein